MKLNIVYKKEKEWFIGHIQEYPDYESQGKTVDELKENLIEIYNDINKDGFVKSLNFDFCSLQHIEITSP
jgi:predicted RNase H-like HicB family nuclease